MSDNESSIQVTEKKKAKRVVSEAHREKLKANLEAARVARVAKIAERRAGKNEDELALKELIAEKKRTKIFGIQDDEEQNACILSSPKALKQSKSKKEKLVESASEDELSEQSEPDDESEVEDSEDVESASEPSESSDDEAEFVLKRKKAAPKAVKVPKAIKKEKVSKSKKAEKESILAEMARMTAEIAALKKEKRKQSKVNVYVNQPEKKEMSAKQRKDLLDL